MRNRCNKSINQINIQDVIIRVIIANMQHSPHEGHQDCDLQSVWMHLLPWNPVQITQLLPSVCFIKQGRRLVAYICNVLIKIMDFFNKIKYFLWKERGKNKETQIIVTMTYIRANSFTYNARYSRSWKQSILTNPNSSYSICSCHFSNYLQIH